MKTKIVKKKLEKMANAGLSGDKAKKPKEDNYSISIKILGRIYTSSAPDLRTAIETLPVGKVAKGMSILEVTHGENKKSVILPPAMTFRVFSSSGIIKEIAMKNLLLKLGGI